MVDWPVEALRHYPELAFFLTLALGYLLGKLRLGSFTLGSVTGVLLAGVAVGQVGIVISADVKQVFFLLFLFSIGYRTGPQFFSGLRSAGLAQAGVAVVVCGTALLVAWLMSLILGFGPGQGAGLIAGALTESATIGTGGDAIARLPLPEAERAALANAIPVAFAVSYLVGVVTVAWFLSQVAPRLMGVDIAVACRELEARLSGGTAPEPDGVISAWRRFELRAFDVGAPAAGRTVAELEAAFAPARVFVDRVRRVDGVLLEAQPGTLLAVGDRLTLAGRREVVVGAARRVGEEVDDRALLDIRAEVLRVMVTRREITGRTLAELATGELARGVFLREITRSGHELPIFPETVVQRGDVVILVGAYAAVERAAAAIGYPDRPTNATDMVFVGLGIVVGGLVGIPAFALGNLAIGLSTSVGVLLGGIVFGWLRSWRPVFGRIPEPALWLFESVGLAGFAAVVGLGAGPDFVRGLAESGPLLAAAAFVVALLPHLAGVLIGHHVFKMHPGILLGVCAGAGTATPALAAVQERAGSAVPTLGYGVSYAIGNVLLALWGTVIVGLLA